MVLLERKIRSSKYIKGQVVSLDAFCNTWVYLMNEDLVGIKSKFPGFPFQRVRVNGFKKMSQVFSKMGVNILCYQ